MIVGGRLLSCIHKDKPSAAVNLRNCAGRILRRLADFPGSVRIIPEFPDLPFREVFTSPYRFFYRIKEDTVWIAAVSHGGQLPDEPIT